MEAFSLLKYWRGGGLVASTAPLTAPNLTSAVAENSDESHETTGDEDDGPFFDLEFSVPDEEAAVHVASGSSDESDVEVQQDGEDEETDDDDDVNGEEGEFNFTVSSGSSNDRTDQNLSMSPSDDLFFKGKLVPIEPSSLVFSSSEPNSKAQFAGSLLKSATKFRVFMSGLKKSKANSNVTDNNKTEPTNGSVQEQLEKQVNKQQKQGKIFTVKLKVEEVPIVSLFTRDNSSRISANKSHNQKTQSSEEAASEDKRFSKEVMQKYLKMVKPLYIRVSKRYGEKTRLPGPIRVSGAQPVEKSQAEPEVSEPGTSNVKSFKQGSIPAGLRVVCKHLGKSRSASSTVAAAPPGTVPSQRRDDSLLQQQDGIQSAILHCKRSFNASRDSDSSPLSRPVSDSCN